jgi:hypothetical protein
MPVVYRKRSEDNVGSYHNAVPGLVTLATLTERGYDPDEK